MDGEWKKLNEHGSEVFLPTALDRVPKTVPVRYEGVVVGEATVSITEEGYISVGLTSSSAFFTKAQEETHYSIGVMPECSMSPHWIGPVDQTPPPPFDAHGCPTYCPRRLWREKQRAAAEHPEARP